MISIAGVRLSTQDDPRLPAKEAKLERAAAIDIALAQSRKERGVFSFMSKSAAQDDISYTRQAAGRFVETRRRQAMEDMPRAHFFPVNSFLRSLNESVNSFRISEEGPAVAAAIAAAERVVSREYDRQSPA